MIVNLDFLHTSPFYELAALLALTAATGLIGLFLRQPMIVSYIAAGILASPSVFGIIKTHDNITQMAQLSITVLLFLVGMKLDIKKIKNLGSVSITTGMGQIIFTSIFGFMILIAMGFDFVSSIYIAVALTFSSTIIIVKLLSDKQEVDALHGRIAIGFLIVQDLVVIVLLMILSSIGGDSQLEIWGEHATTKILTTIAIIIIMAALLVFFIRYLATPLINRIAKSHELLIVFSISWAALLAALCSFMGFGKELGGLLAGISLASTPFRESIISRLSPLRDFLLLFFFISLGSQMDLSTIGAQVFPSIILSIFVLIGNPLIVMIIMGYMGYRKRTGLFAGLTVAQISEFSLILIAAGIASGQIQNDSLGLVTLTGLITIAISIYMITYSHVIYKWLEPVLWIFERKTPYREVLDDNKQIENKRYDVVLFGLGRYGKAIGKHLKEKNYSILGIDYDPSAVKYWQKTGSDAVYGDVCDHELFTKPLIKNSKWIISALPQDEFAVFQEDPSNDMIEALKQNEYKGRIAVSSHKDSEAEQYLSKGVELVFLPFNDAAERAVEKIIEFDSFNTTKE